MFKLKRYLMVFLCVLCLLNITACSKEGNQEENIDTNLYGNLEIKNDVGEVLITIDDIKAVEISTVVDENSNKEYYVGISFTDNGTTKFANITKENIGKSLSIYVDDELISQPMINSVIEGGYAQLTGYSNYEEAEKLMNAIKGSKDDKTTDEHISGVVKITENDGTILVESSQIEYASMETRSIGKGGSNVQVIVLYFTEDGTSIMESKTKKLIGEEINVVVYGELVHSVILDEAIKNGELIIDTIEDYGKMTEVWSEIQDGK